MYNVSSFVYLDVICRKSDVINKLLINYIRTEPPMSGKDSECFISSSISQSSAHLIHQYMTCRSTGLHCATLLHYITLCYLTLHYIILNYIIVSYITLYYLALHHIILHYIMYLTLYYIILYSLVIINGRVNAALIHVIDVKT